MSIERLNPHVIHDYVWRTGAGDEIEGPHLWPLLADLEHDGFKVEPFMYGDTGYGVQAKKSGERDRLYVRLRVREAA